jgi:peptidoglycan/xylan/chitin deacetylase (PgdA/CDA1 family)
MYHSVGEAVPDDTRGFWNVPALAFSDQMAFIRDQGNISPVALSVGSGGCDQISLSLTFDDGYVSVLKNAAPVLCKIGLPFSVFVCPGLMDSADRFYMSRAQVLELAKMPGCEIGSHTVNHARLAELDDAILTAELQDSKSRLEDLLGMTVSSLAYPQGSADSRVMLAAQKAGYTLAVCSRTGINLPGRNSMMLKRTDILGDDDFPMFRLKTLGGWDWHEYRYADPLKE